jgi:TPR repeat protein
MLRQIDIHREAALAPWKNLRSILVVYALGAALGPPVIIGVGGLLKSHYNFAFLPKPPELPADAPIVPSEAPTAVPVPRRLESDPPPAPFNRDEIATLVARGRTLLAEGDVSAARLFLRWAAESGVPEAAVALGGTYDPLVLARLGLSDSHADAAAAQIWYRRAAELGSRDAVARLKDLANTIQ